MTGYIKLVLAEAIMLLALILYGKCRCGIKNFPDILDYQLTPHIDGWVIMHFLAYIPIGMLFPNMFYSAMFLGIMWEFFEVWAGETKPSFLKGIGDCRISSKDGKITQKLLSDNKNTSGKQTYWWYGQYEDVIANCLGFLVGSYFFSAKR